MRQYTKNDAQRTVAEVRVLNISKLDRPAKSDGADSKGAAA
jgi:hypothetical protein